MIGLCTDSSAQLPLDLVQRFGAEVVPATIRVGDHEYLEGVDLDADRFFDLVRSGSATVATSAPSPGQFALAYEDLGRRGCTEIISVHPPASASGTIGAARLAAHRSEVPVRIVDAGAVGFGVGCCLWAVGEALSAGATLDEAVATGEAMAPTIGNVFVAVGARSVLTLRDGVVEMVADAADPAAAMAAMASAVVGWGDRIRVGVGMADRVDEAMADGLAGLLRDHPSIDDVVRFRIGPSSLEHTGASTVGCFMFPTETAPSIRASN